MPRIGTPDVEDRLRRARRTFVQHGRRTAGQDDGLGRQRGKGFVGLLERRDLAIDAGLAHAPRDELRHLRAEIDDQHLVVTLYDVLVQIGLDHFGPEFFCCAYL